jgi:hypothetical protein
VEVGCGWEAGVVGRKKEGGEGRDMVERGNERRNLRH